jgi:hypothetical protein
MRDVDGSVIELIRWPDVPYHKATIAEWIVTLAVSVVWYPGLFSKLAAGGHCVPSLSQVLSGSQVITVPRSEVRVILMVLSGIPTACSFNLVAMLPTVMAQLFPPVMQPRPWLAM